MPGPRQPLSGPAREASTCHQGLMTHDTQQPRLLRACSWAQEAIGSTGLMPRLLQLCGSKHEQTSYHALQVCVLHVGA